MQKGSLVPVIVGYSQTANLIHSAITSAKQLAQQTAVMLAKGSRAPNVFLQIAALIAAIQNTNLDRSVVPLFERLHVSITRVASLFKQVTN